jgi:hypothetical protein
MSACGAPEDGHQTAALKSSSGTSENLAADLHVTVPRGWTWYELGAGRTKPPVRLSIARTVADVCVGFDAGAHVTRAESVKRTFGRSPAS